MQNLMVPFFFLTINTFEHHGDAANDDMLLHLLNVLISQTRQ